MTAHNDQQPDASRDARGTSPSATGRVLIVDDEAAVAMLLQETLRMMGYAVKHAATGEDALDDVVTFEPDAVLLDLMLPGMTGGEVLDILRQRRPSLPVIVMTGNSEQLTRVLGRGAVAYLTKPFSIQSLEDALGAALRRE